ncbi:hypothetical protein WKW50_07200 [Ochrobactrum sp. GPK 3]
MIGEGLNYVAQLVGVITLAGGGGGLIAYRLLSTTAKGWLNKHFDTQLERFKGEQTKEIERIKAELNALHDRKQRLHQLEFNSIPQIWSSLCAADEQCRRFLSPLREYSDVKTLGDRGITESLSKFGAIDSEIQNVLQSSKKQESYQWFVEKYKYNHAVDKFLDFRKNYQEGSLYVDETLALLLDKYMNLSESALREQSNNLLEDIRPWSRTSTKEFESQSKQLFDDIRTNIRHRLMNAA